MTKLKIKKNDTVVVISGASKGTKGKVVKIFPKQNRAIVEGVNLISRHTKPNSANPEGGIIQQEAALHISNLMLFHNNQTSRIGYKRLKNGNKVRISVKTKEEI